MRSQVTYEISLVYKQDTIGKRELLFCLFESIGIPARDIVEFDEQGQGRLSFFTTKRGKALALKQTIVKLALKGINIKVTSLKDIEWQTKWKVTYKPFCITKEI